MKTAANILEVCCQQPAGVLLAPTSKSASKFVLRCSRFFRMCQIYHSNSHCKVCDKFCKNHVSISSKIISSQPNRPVANNTGTKSKVPDFRTIALTLPAKKLLYGTLSVRLSQWSIRESDGAPISKFISGKLNQSSKVTFIRCNSISSLGLKVSNHFLQKR